MTCAKCGALNPTVHLTRIVDGNATQSHYCESCFDLTQFKAGMTLSAKVRATPQSQADFQSKAQPRPRVPPMHSSFKALLDELCSKEPRFALEAYHFVLMGLSRAVKKAAIPSQVHPRHVTARQLVEGCDLHLKEAYGPSAAEQLKTWGIGASADIGDIVFLLVEYGGLGKRPEDKREHFNNLPFPS
jgi:uncharacterized repeat protein (TIGR04138 family)